MCCGSNSVPLDFGWLYFSGDLPAKAGPPPFFGILSVRISPELPTVIIGERINPTGENKLADALLAGDLSLVQELAQTQVEAGDA